MFIVRWLLSHPIIFVWVLAVMALLMGYSMDKDHASAESESIVTTEQVTGVEHVVTAEQDAAMAEQAARAEKTAAAEEAVAPEVPVASEKPATPTESVAAVEPVTATTPDASNTTEEAPAYKNAAEKRVAEASTEEILSTGFFDKLFGKADKIEANAATGDGNTAAAETTAESVSEDTAGAATENTVVTEVEVVTVEATDQNKVPQAKSNIELLRSAREAYWAADYNASIKFYQQLIVEQPDVIDHKGELANVYWKQGSPEKAAELYADIAMPLIDLGKVNQVQTMNDFIGQFLPERAKEIAAKLHP